MKKTIIFLFAAMLMAFPVNADSKRIGITGSSATIDSTVKDDIDSMELLILQKIFQTT